MPYPPCTVTAFWPRYRGVPGPCPDAASGNTTSPYCRAVIKNTQQRLVHSASRTASNKMYHDKTALRRLSVIPRRAITQPNTSADPHIKNWHSRHNIFKSFVNMTNYSNHKTCTATPDLANFLSLPWPCKCSLM